MAIELLHTILHALILLNVQLQILQRRQFLLDFLTWHRLLIKPIIKLAALKT